MEAAQTFQQTCDQQGFGKRFVFKASVCTMCFVVLGVPQARADLCTYNSGARDWDVTVQCTLHFLERKIENYVIFYTKNITSYQQTYK